MRHRHDRSGRHSLSSILLPMTDQSEAPAASPPAVAADIERPADGNSELANVELVSEQSENLGPLFAALGISVLVSTYQAGKLIVLRHQDGRLNTHFRHAPKPMGIAVADGQFAVGLTGEIQFYENVKENCVKLDPPDRHDACFVPRYTHNTGDIDIHEMAFAPDGRLWFINTRFSTLCTLQDSSSFTPAWRPPFISAYEPEDRCHLNGLAMMNGQPRYVTALGESDKRGGWRERKADGGVLIDLANNRTLVRGLSMPHSPRWHANQLWVCESGRGTLSKVDYATGAMTSFFEFPGFTRGLDFFGDYAFVGLSQIRESAIFSGIPITERADERNCGVWIIDLRDASLAGILRFTEGVHEIFAVQVLPAYRFPEVLLGYDKLALETYFLSPEIVSPSSR